MYASDSAVAVQIVHTGDVQGQLVVEGEEPYSPVVLGNSEVNVQGLAPLRTELDLSRELWESPWNVGVLAKLRPSILRWGSSAWSPSSGILR